MKFKVESGKGVSMNIEVGKFYKTRDGRKVRIYSHDVFEIHGLFGLVLLGQLMLGPNKDIIIQP